MRSVYILASLQFISVLVLAGEIPREPQSEIQELSRAASKRPHIIVMLADDLGWRDVSWHDDRMKTPHLQHLADTGVLLNQSYFHPKCSPSRAALLTGYYPHRLGLQRCGVGRFHAYGLDTKYQILPQYLQQAGYSSHLVGKWHLGYCKKELLPNHRGFDTFFGQWSHSVDYYTRMSVWRRGINPKMIGYDLHENDDISTEYKGLFSSEMYSKRSQSIIENHDKSKPLFLMVSFQSPHSPIPTPHVKFTSQYNSGMNRRQRNRAATITALDTAVGDIVESLKAAGLYDNSVILFSSDNGGEGNKYNRPLRGRKEQLFEGGVRVVSLVNSPLLASPGQVYPGLVHVTDWFSSILHLAGVGDSIPQDTNSLNVFPSIVAGSDSPRAQIVHNIDEDQDKGSWQAVIRDGDFKMLWGQTTLLEKNYKKLKKFKRDQKTLIQLYNIADDPYEKHPLSKSEYSDVIKRLQGILLEEYEKTNFPTYYEDIEKAFPQYNNGVFVTDWC